MNQKLAFAAFTFCTAETPVGSKYS